MSYQVSSEIYSEKNYTIHSNNDKNRISRFIFKQPKDKFISVDKDGDFDLKRNEEYVERFVEIEHSPSTVLKLVGLQVWRGALLLADFVISIKDQLQGKTVLELGSGVGLTSIVASMYAKHVVCTDVDMGDILPLIRKNVKRNLAMTKGKITVAELDFLNQNWVKTLQDNLKDVDIVLVADVIYDNDITDAFVKTLKTLLELKKMTVYIALEKRFVFTLAELDSVAPCYEHFLLKMAETLATLPQCTSQQIDLDFPQYFMYDRIKHLVLWKVTSK